MRNILMMERIGKVRRAMRRLRSDENELVWTWVGSDAYHM